MENIETENNRSWDEIAIEELTEEIGACKSTSDLRSLIYRYENWEAINVDILYPSSEWNLRKKIIREKRRTAICELSVRLAYETLNCASSSAEEIQKAKEVVWWEKFNKMYRGKLPPNCGEEMMKEIMAEVLSECECPDGHYMSLEEFLSKSQSVLSLD